MPDDPELHWLPDEGVYLTRAELEQIFRDLRLVVRNVPDPSPLRFVLAEIVGIIEVAAERGRGGEL